MCVCVYVRARVSDMQLMLFVVCQHKYDTNLE